MKLTIELVPATCWYTNVRSNVSRETWDVIRRKCYLLAGYVCEICGETGRYQGYKHKLECHEIWDYDDQTHIQKLIGFIGLCPLCHEIKHAGLTITRKGLEVILSRLMKVNNWTDLQAADHITNVFEVWEIRTRHDWKLDISYLASYIGQHTLAHGPASPPLPAAG